MVGEVMKSRVETQHATPMDGYGYQFESNRA